MLATVASGSRRLCQYGSVVHTDGAYDGRSAAQHETTARITLASVAVYTYTLGKGVLHPRLPSLAPRTVARNIGANTHSSISSGLVPADGCVSASASEWEELLPVGRKYEWCGLPTRTNVLAATKFCEHKPSLNSRFQKYQYLRIIGTHAAIHTHILPVTESNLRCVYPQKS